MGGAGPLARLGWAGCLRALVVVGRWWRWVRGEGFLTLQGGDFVVKGGDCGAFGVNGFLEVYDLLVHLVE